MSPNAFDADAIDVALVRRIVAAQFPRWADLPVRPVDLSGWDNRTFRLGGSMSVRLPSAEGYVLQVEKEQRWLPKLALELPLPIPTPLAQGAPSGEYPWPWSVYRWLEGEPATAERIADLNQFATDLSHFLNVLYSIDATGGPPPGPHNFYRGGPLTVYDGETREALRELEGKIDTRTARAVWDEALGSSWQGAPVWFHGDIAWGSLLVWEGRLSAVIDFGTSGGGDPACDLAIAWTLFHGESRKIFRDALGFDEGTWVRGRGWTLWKALITLAEFFETDAVKAAEARRVIGEVLNEFGRGR